MTTGLAAVDVSYRYDDGHLALDAVSLTVAPGDRIALVGPSGSGKTTLATMLLALDRPTTGTVTLDDRPVRPGAGRRLGWFRSEVQYIPQDPGSSLDPRKSALEQVVRPLRWLRAPGDHRDRARDALLSVGLGAELFAARPNELSGGQKQRVAVARALVCRPRFLVADEPVSGLDADTADLVLTMVTAHCDRFSTALLMVTHDLTVAASAATTLAVMDDGRVVESGSTAAVLGDPQHHRTRALLDAIPRPVGL